MEKLYYMIIFTVLFFGGWFIYFQFDAPAMEVAKLALVPNLTLENYQIYFVKQAQDANELVMYMIQADNKQEKFVTKVSKDVFSQAEASASVYKDGKKYVGQFESPDKSKKIVIETGIFGTGLLPSLSTPKIYLEQNGKKTFYLKSVIEQMRWLPDNKTIAFVKDNSITLLNTETKQYSYLTAGTGITDIK